MVINNKVLEQINAARAEINRKRSELQEIIKESFLEIAGELFEKYPTMESFSWKQYTPYFNDGEPCTFEVYADYPKINELEEWDTKRDAPELVPAFKEVKEFLQNFDEEDMKAAFDDHAKIIVTKNKIEIMEYDHD